MSEGDLFGPDVSDEPRETVIEIENPLDVLRELIAEVRK
jgi:hypothetical protein